MSNTIASDTLVEAVARAVAERLEAFDIHGIPQAALTAIADAGMAIVPREPTEAMIAAGQLEAEGCTDDWTASAACLSGHVWSAMLAMHAATHYNNNGKAE